MSKPAQSFTSMHESLMHAATTAETLLVTIMEGAPQRKLKTNAFAPSVTKVHRFPLHVATLVETLLAIIMEDAVPHKRDVSTQRPN